MLKIVERNVEVVGHFAEFKLENGILLYGMDWNGEEYRNGYNSENGKETNRNYRPVYKFQEENINIVDIEENSDDWYEAMKIVGFDEI